jgi:hypothetical protein
MADCVAWLAIIFPFRECKSGQACARLSPVPKLVGILTPSRMPPAFQGGFKLLAGLETLQHGVLNGSVLAATPPASFDFGQREEPGEGRETLNPLEGELDMTRYRLRV